MNLGLMILFVLVCFFILMKIAAEIKTEPESINDDNPYLHPEKKYILPESMKDLKPVKRTKRTAGNYERWCKRIIDVVLSFFGLIILSPVFLILVIWIKTDDPGPAFFSQKRVGKGKKYFVLHKFRSMKVDAPQDIPTNDMDDRDQYITKAGRFLRRYSLDELPQIWDVFRGKMSLIGPRPALWNQADLVEEREKYAANDVVPGLTGWAQVNGRDELEIEEKARLDGVYCRHISLFMDMRCFFRTIGCVIRHEGVAEGGAGELYKHEGPEE